MFKSGGGVGGGGGGAVLPPTREGRAMRNNCPVEYTMMLHPPLVVENLLPHAGDFELLDQVRTQLFLFSREGSFHGSLVDRLAEFAM